MEEKYIIHPRSKTWKKEIVLELGVLSCLDLIQELVQNTIIRVTLEFVPMYLSKQDHPVQNSREMVNAKYQALTKFVNKLLSDNEQGISPKEDASLKCKM